MAGKSRRSKKSKKSPAAANARRNAAAMGKKARRSRSSARARSHERDLGNAAEYTFSGSGSAFGFAVPADGGEDLFIPPQLTMGAMHGDKVLVRRIREGERFFGKGNEGEVVEIVARGCTEVVGTLHRAGDMIYVAPDEKKIGAAVEVEDSVCDIADGDKVRVRIDAYPDEYRRRQYVRRRRFAGNDGTPEAVAAGCVIANYGSAETKDANYRAILDAAGIPQVFGDPVIAEAERAAEEVLLPNGRLDLRGDIIFTIDGAGAKDLDDAITLEKTEQGYRLGVHIADVTHYVREGSPLDREALKRGTSVYLTDRVIPMLPHKLSNGICSLNQGEDRLALSCIMEINDKGVVIGHEIAETLIRVDRRMTYTAVNAIITDDDAETKEKYKEFVDLFLQMKELSQLLRKRRQERGAIDFDFPESKILLDAKGRPIEIKPYERNAATKLIEDFMLMANETVAEDYYWQEMPFLYRIHEKPDEEKMAKLGTFINNFGYTLRMPGGEVHPKELQKLLEKIEGTPEEALLSRLTLRSMKQAKYSTLNSGHFGLAAKYYTHFTSPIRRYPDLQIHRIIKECLHGNMDARKTAHFEKILPEVAVQTSALERRADEAERETDKMKKVQYMEHYIGEEFEGVISGVTNWGFYVELPNTVEGLVHVNELRGDYFVFDEAHYELVGEMTRKTYKLGQTIRVRVTACDRYARTIDFMPAVYWK